MSSNNFREREPRESSAKDSALGKREPPAEKAAGSDDSLSSKRLKEAVTLSESTPKASSRWDSKERIPVGGLTPLRPLDSRSNWDRSERVRKLLQTPSTQRELETPRSVRSYFGDDPASGPAAPTPVVLDLMTDEQKATVRGSGVDIDPRNRYMTDEELDSLLPSTGYEIVKPPADYKPVRVTRDLLSGATGSVSSGAERSFAVSERHGEELPAMREDDLQHFGALLRPQSQLSAAETREQKVLALLLKIKNGTPPIRKAAMKILTDRARDFGADLLFGQLLPLLLSPTLDEWERHLMVKVLDRVLFRLEEMVRPYVPRILAVVGPMLSDEDNYVRSEGRELVANLAKAAGLPSMITALRADIDSSDDLVRNTTSRAFAVIAGALGLPSLIPFLRAVCLSKKSWQARFTGCKIVQQIAILLGCGITPFLPSLVGVLKPCLSDEQPRVRVLCALAVAALAEASAPFGIEAFDELLEQLFVALNQHRGKALAAFLRAFGSLIPLMDDSHAGEYIQLAIPVLLKEFESSEDEMKRILLRVVRQCLETRSISPDFIRSTLRKPFWENFWLRKLCMDRIAAEQLVATTAAMARKLGARDVLRELVPLLRQDHDQLRRCAMEATVKSLQEGGTADIDLAFEETLIDAAMFAFHQQVADDKKVILDGFASVVASLGLRAKRFLHGIVANICIRLKTGSPRIRQLAADLIVRLASVLYDCDEHSLLQTLGQMLYENLGEEFPEVLGSIIAAMRAIVEVVGMRHMVPSIRDLLPSLTPILQNRHEKIQEQLVELIGRIADRGSEYVNPKEWIRICFDLLDLLKADRKSIRRATVNAFGYIARAVGPQDVLITLINNLKVQERQMRICTTIAIAIVAESCGPFTVIPALMNEYRVPSNNIQNGVLKAFAFMFEYIGEMAKDYVYAVTTLLEDALIDRDLVHRQTAATTLRHMSLGVIGMGCEDALIHLFNFVIANVFETSPHVVNAVTEAFESLRLSVGPGYMLLYILHGLFHPARRVREIYWRLYNILYVGSQDALTPFYPILKSYGEECDYTPTEGLYYQF